MKHNQLLRMVLSSSAAALLTGCSTPINTIPAITSSGTSTSAGSSGSTGTSPNLQSPTILVAEATGADENILAFDGSGNGEMRPSWTLPGTHPHLDAAGNLYVIRCFFPRQSCTETSQRIEVYGPDLSVTTPLRSIPTGPGTKIPKLVDMAVSRTERSLSPTAMVSPSSIPQQPAMSIPRDTSSGVRQGRTSRVGQHSRR